MITAPVFDQITRLSRQPDWASQQTPKSAAQTPHHQKYTSSQRPAYDKSRYVEFYHPSPERTNYVRRRFETEYPNSSIG